MSHGDFLCLTADGFIEWQRADGKAFGTERLCETLRAASDLSSREIIEAACRAVSEFVTPAQQQDDLTAVVIKQR
jgi:serine phosphatase RsbU (regulator of sigma subunit)